MFGDSWRRRAALRLLEAQGSPFVSYYLTPYFLHAAATAAVQMSEAFASPAATTVLTVAALIRIGVEARNGVPSASFLVTVTF
jgi:hypothetical protein